MRATSPARSRARRAKSPARSPPSWSTLPSASICSATSGPSIPSNNLLSTTRPPRSLSRRSDHAIMKSAGNNPPCRFEWAALSDIGQRRKNNEDSWGVFSLDGGQAGSLQAAPVGVPGQGLLLIMSDGMGGSRAGEEASRFCVDRLPVELAARAAGSGSPGGKLHDSIISTHEALVGRSKTQEAWGGMGATLSALWILPAGGKVVGHLGRSPGYVPRP